PTLFRSESVTPNEVEHARDSRILLQNLTRVIAVLLPGQYLIRGHPEDEGVVLAYRLGDLDVGTVQSADGKGTIQGELHVPGSGGLIARSGDLFRQVAAREDDLSERDPVIGDEGYP